METGFSLYVGTDPAVTKRTIDCAHAVGIQRAFTSMQIPEEDGDGFKEGILSLFDCCREAGIGIVADVSPAIARRLGLSSMGDLAQLGVACIRLDYGFSDIETVELSKMFEISINASTTTAAELDRWGRLGADLTRFIACHNFYPKPYTGLSLEYVGEINAGFRARGINTAAFIPGDDVLRGPLHEGLPTVEAHRETSKRVVKNALELFELANCNSVYVGDPCLSDAGWRALGMLRQGVVPLHVDFDEGFEFLYGTDHRDRMDSSPYVLRSIDSRMDVALRARLASFAKMLKGTDGPRLPGDVLLSLDSFGRYSGELELARMEMRPDRRTAVVGRVSMKDLDLLPLIRRGMSVRFLKP